MLKFRLPGICSLAAFIIGSLVLATPPAQAKVNIWISPGFGYWHGPGRYYGRYYDRLNCNEGRYIVDRHGFDAVRAIDCTPRYYAYKAIRRGKWYTVRLDSLTGNIRY